MRTILVIEDDPNVRDNIHDLLKYEGYQVLTAPNGRDGLKAAHIRHPDLVICDIMMPDVNGYDVLRQIRQHPTTRMTPFIFLTAKAARADLREGMDMGADDYLIKPFTSEELLKAVNIRLERYETQNQWYAKRLEDLRSNLSRSLPHEMRTPLSCILGYSEFLLEVYDTLDKQELKAMLEEINDSGKRLEHLIENYYLYAQLELATANPVWHANLLGQGMCNPEEAIFQVAEKIAQRYDRSEDLEVHAAEAQASIQALYWEKVLEELLDNAFKFSDPGTKVGVYGLKEEDFYVLEVRDTGRGVAQNQLEEVDAFVQFDRDQYEQQGLGLGLSIARRLVELHQGAFQIESTKGEGTSVWIWLPLAK